jgi:AraC-like DNA-binding protein
MVRVLALLPDTRARKRLAAALALRDRAWSSSLGFASRWAEARTMACANATQMLVFDSYATGCFDGRPVAHFAEQFPSCVLVGYSQFPHGCARDVLVLSRAGVHEIATMDLDDAPTPLADLLDCALENGTLTKALLLLERRTPPAIRDLLPALLFRADGCLTPAEVARHCHCHPKTLRAHLRNAGLPSTGKLIVWTRLIHACHLLQDPGRSVERVALVLGFDSANNFRNQLLRYVGLRPTDLRERARVESVLERFQAALGPGGGPKDGSSECDQVAPPWVSAARRDIILSAGGSAPDGAIHRAPLGASPLCTG